MLEMYDAIVESEKTRSDFLKWKLIGVAALGAVGLGLSQTGGTNSAEGAIPVGAGMHAYFLLLLIPPVCFYVDLLCRHISLRILVIAAGLRHYGSYEQQEFQKFVKREAEVDRVLYLEDMALEYSTIALCFVIALIGIFPQMLLAVTGQRPECVFRISAFVAGAVGTGAAAWFRRVFHQGRKKLDSSHP